MNIQNFENINLKTFIDYQHAKQINKWSEK